MLATIPGETDLSPSRLLTEVEAAIEWRKKVTRPAAERIKQYAQNMQEGWEPFKDLHENHPFEHITNVIPDLVYSNPGVDVSTVIPGIGDQLAESMGLALNQWVQDTDLVEVLDETAYDGQFSFMVAMLSMEPVPGYQDDATPADSDANQPIQRPAPLRPKAVRISPTRWFVDPMATTYDNARFVGHTWIRDKEDLENARNPDGSFIFDQEALKQLAADVALDRVYDKSLYNEPPQIGGELRNQVVGYEVYVRETGKIYTLGHVEVSGKQGAPVFLREPRDYFGHPQGPYVYGFIHRVPDMLFPLAPLAATEDISDEVSTMIGQVKDDAASAKQLHLIDATVKSVSAVITNAKNGDVIAVPGLKDVYKLLEMGKPNEALMMYIQIRRGDMQRRSGMTNTALGQTDPNVTATADAISDKSSDKRTRYAQNQFRKFVRRILTGAAWLMWHSHEVQIELKIPNEQDGTEQAATFYGGPPEEGSPEAGVPFEALSFKIQPYSMEYVDAETRQKRAMVGFQISTEAAPAFVNFPFLKIALLDDMYQALNIVGGADRYIDKDILETMRQMKLMEMGIAVQQMQLGLAQGQMALQNPAMAAGGGAGAAGSGPTSTGPSPTPAGGAGGSMMQGPSRRLGGKSELSYDPVAENVASMSRAA